MSHRLLTQLVLWFIFGLLVLWMCGPLFGLA
jgi:hypothetical protein